VHTADVEPVTTLLYDPARHAVHTPLPVVIALYLPASQAVHTVEILATATLPNLPAPQVVHVVDAELPARLLYAPAPHAVQDRVPVTRSVYEPAAHTVQTTDVEPAATTPYLPATQDVHAEDPVVSAL